MSQFHHSASLTDSLERRLIQNEVNQQMSFTPVFNLKRVADKVASLLGYARVENTLSTTRTAEA